MIKVCVSKNHCIQLPRLYWKILPIALAPFLVTLEKATVNQTSEIHLPIWIRQANKMFRSRNRSRRAQKLYVTQASLEILAVGTFAEPNQAPQFNLP
jgi:hypothetical protein